MNLEEFKKHVIAQREASKAEAAVVVCRSPLETQVTAQHHRCKGPLHCPAVWGRGARNGADPAALKQQSLRR